jgi:topoisomerase IA-like protein
MRLHPPARRSGEWQWRGGADGDRELGKDPYTGEEIWLKSGRFGPYVQRGEGKEAKRTSLPKGWTVMPWTTKRRWRCWRCRATSASIPRRGKMITAGLGRYGPFVLHDGTYANLESIEDVFSIGINRAVSVIAEKQSKGGRGRTSAALKELGEHPDGGAITVRDGRYGPYVNWAKVNATLPNGKEPQSVTLEEALELIAAKAAKGGKGKKTATKKAPAKKPGRKKERGQEAAAKKTPPRRRRNRVGKADNRALQGKATARALRPPATTAPAASSLLAFIQENPDQAGKREIARAFGLKGPDRVWLKDSCCAIGRRRAARAQGQEAGAAGGLPHVVVLDIFGRGTDGELLARPSEWPEEKAPGRWCRSACRAAPRAAPRVSASGFWPRSFPSDDPEGPAYTARVLKIIDKRRESVLGVVRVIWPTAHGGWSRWNGASRNIPSMPTIAAMRRPATWSRPSRSRRAATACRARRSRARSAGWATRNRPR